MAAPVSTSLLDRRSLMSPSFLDELDAFNEQKKPSAPLALIFQSKDDETGTITSLASQYCYLQIAQTHLIALKAIDDFKEIQTEINRVTDLVKSNLNCIILHAHSSSSAGHPTISFSKTSEYGVKNAQEEDFNGNATEISLLLFSCQTARLAKHLSLILDRKVCAPVEDITPTSTYFSYCPRHLCLEMSSYSDGENHVLLYRRDGSTAARSSCTEKSKKEVQAEFAAYLVTRDPASLEGRYLVTLGDYYTTGDHGIAQSKEKGSHCYQLAARKLEEESLRGNKLASFLLANLYYNGHGIPQCLEKAIQYFEISILQGCPKAHEFLGKLKRLEQANKKITACPD